MSLKELNTCTEGTGILYSNNTVVNGSWVSWGKIGHIVHVNYWVKINSNPSAAWTGYLIATKLPKAARSEVYIQGVCIDNYRSDAFAVINNQSDFTVSARMTPIANTVIVGGFCYLAQ